MFIFLIGIVYVCYITDSCPSAQRFFLESSTFLINKFHFHKILEPLNLHISTPVYHAIPYIINSRRVIILLLHTTHPTLILVYNNE